MAATISLTGDPLLLRDLVIGAAIGIGSQVAGGSRRAVGILLATGLLLDNLIYGYALAAALALRAAWGTGRMAVRAPGLIAGDGIAGFVAALTRAF
jgi:zinc transporter ZupT